MKVGRNRLPLLPAQHINAVPENGVKEDTSSVNCITGERLNWVSLEEGEKREGGGGGGGRRGRGGREKER